MPALEDRMSLHFPSREENDCYLLNWTREPYKSTKHNVSETSCAGHLEKIEKPKDDRLMPHSKYLRAPNGQTVNFEPDLIHFHSKDYHAALELHEKAEMQDEEMKLGIRITTKGDALIQGENVSLGSVCVCGSKKVDIAGNDDIVLNCAGNYIKLDGKKNKITIKGLNVNIDAPKDEELPAAEESTQFWTWAHLEDTPNEYSRTKKHLLLNQHHQMERRQ